MLPCLRTAYRVPIILAGILVSPALLAAGISPTDKYAWSENTGWLNFNSTNNSASVQVYPDHLEGYVWAENIGWIRLGAYSGGGAHTYANTSSTNYGVNHNGAGALSGYAWSENAGWINFQGVTLNLATGQFDGYAWGENIGYIHFRNASPAYQVAFVLHLLTVNKTGSGSGTVTSQDGQINCGPACPTSSAAFPAGASVTLTAQAADGSVFDGWSGHADCADGQVIMDGDKTCTVAFLWNPAKVYTVLPCRVADTRKTGPGNVPFSGQIQPNQTIHFHVTSNLIAGQGGAADCGVPLGATGAFLNLTAVNPTGTGYLTFYPYGEAKPNASTLNFQAGRIATANGVLVPLCDPAVGSGCANDLTLTNGPGASVHLVIDVSGYLAAPEVAP